MIIPAIEFYKIKFNKKILVPSEHFCLSHHMNYNFVSSIIYWSLSGNFVKTAYEDIK